MSNNTPENFDGIGRRCLTVFGVVMAITLMMVAVHYAHLSTTAGMALILTAAAVNAALVAGYLMHIVTEKRFIIVMLLFTAFFFTMLFVLTISARMSVPHGTVH